MSLAEDGSGWGQAVPGMLADADKSQEGRAPGGIHRVHTWEQGWGMLSCSCSLEQLSQYCIPCTPQLPHTQQWVALKTPKEASGFWRAQGS